MKAGDWVKAKEYPDEFFATLVVRGYLSKALYGGRSRKMLELDGGAHVYESNYRKATELELLEDAWEQGRRAQEWSRGPENPANPYTKLREKR